MLMFVDGGEVLRRCLRWFQEVVVVCATYDVLCMNCLGKLADHIKESTTARQGTQPPRKVTYSSP